jgi:hypothetical protein
VTVITVRIEAPHFVAGVDVDEKDDRVVHAAPIVSYMRGWSAARVLAYCAKKDWSVMLLARDETRVKPPNL